VECGKNHRTVTLEANWGQIQQFRSSRSNEGSRNVTQDCRDKRRSDHEIRESLLIAAAKARVWAREIVVTDGEEKALDPAGFEKLFELKQATALTFGANEP
jgi:hypothetical protein